MKKRLAVIFWAGCVLASTATIAEARPKVGLALSGGGARGVAHIGVLKVLEAQQIPIDYIAGTSMGAIVGGLYASGMSSAELEALVNNIEWDKAFQDEPTRETLNFKQKNDQFRNKALAKVSIDKKRELSNPLGLLEGQNLYQMLKGYIAQPSHIKHFDDFPIPFRAVASDLGHGKPYVFDRGDLATAIRASMSIPGLLAPVKHQGLLLADGGIVNNLPVDVVKEMGADVVIAVDIGTPLSSTGDIKSVLSIMDQLATIMTRGNTEERIAMLDDQDILITPSLGDITTGSFDRSVEAITPGITAANAQLDKLRPLSVDRASWQALRARKKHQTEPVSPRAVSLIKLRNNSEVADTMLHKAMEPHLGKPYNQADIDKTLEKLYAQDYFALIDADQIEHHGQTGILLRTRGKSQGTSSIRLQATLENDFDNNAPYNFAIAGTFKPMNTYGGELRTELQIGYEPHLLLDYYQPFSLTSKGFLNPWLKAGSRQIGIYADRLINLAEIDIEEYDPPEKIGELHLMDVTGALELGRLLGNSAEIRLGGAISWIEQDLTSGAEGVIASLNDEIIVLEEKEDGTNSELYTEFNYDSLNNVWYPTAGRLGTAFVRYALDELKDDEQYFKMGVKHREVFSPSPSNTMTLDLAYLRSDVDRLPFHDQYRLGGFFRLSGIPKDSVGGGHLALARLGWLHRFNDQSLLFDYPLFGGLSFEGGNIWNDRSEWLPEHYLFSTGVFGGVVTPLGPFYLGYARANTDQGTLYMSLGIEH
jgi:NTE family protein